MGKKVKGLSLQSRDEKESNGELHDADYQQPKQRASRLRQRKKRLKKERESQENQECVPEQHCREEERKCDLSQVSESKQSRTQILEGFRSSLQVLKKGLSKARAEYQEHQNCCMTLDKAIQSKIKSIGEMQKTIKQTQRDIFQNSSSSDEVLFFNPFTFTQATSFEKFYDNLATLPANFRACVYSTHSVALNFWKLPAGAIAYFNHLLYEMEQVKNAVQFHFSSFPYISLPESEIGLVQALVKCEAENADVAEDLTDVCQILLQLPGLFVRKSEFSQVTRLKATSMIYNIIFKDPSQIFLKSISKLMQSHFAELETGHKQIQELLGKALVNYDIICLPDNKQELRGFCFNRKIYVNSYYLERAQKRREEIINAYIVFVLLRETTNYLIDEILLKNRRKLCSLEQVIECRLKRTDYGAKLEGMLTQQGIMAVHVADCQTLSQESVNFDDLNNSNNATDESVYFEEHRQQNQQRVAELSEKYGNLGAQQQQRKNQSEQEHNSSDEQPYQQ